MNRRATPPLALPHLSALPNSSLNFAGAPLTISMSSTPVRSIIAKASPGKTAASRSKTRPPVASAGHLHNPPDGFTQSQGNITLLAGETILSVTGTNKGEQPPRVRRLQYNEHGVWTCVPTTGPELGCQNLVAFQTRDGHRGKCLHIKNWENGSVSFGGTYFKRDPA